jgi:hypothetical protein
MCAFPPGITRFGPLNPPKSDAFPPGALCWPVEESTPALDPPAPPSRGPKAIRTFQRLRSLRTRDFAKMVLGVRPSRELSDQSRAVRDQCGGVVVPLLHLGGDQGVYAILIIP